MVERGNDGRKYIRLNNTHNVWGITYKCASTTLRDALPQPRGYTRLREGDHVRIIVRDPRDRLISAWKWFTSVHKNSYIKEILDVSRVDHDFLLDDRADFTNWAQTALKYWNPHWAPQSDIHPRWREFELIRITELPPGWGHEKKTRVDNEWEEHFTPELLGLINEVYSEDLEMWKEIKDGTDTGTNRILQCDGGDVHDEGLQALGGGR